MSIVNEVLRAHDDSDDFGQGRPDPLALKVIRTLQNQLPDAQVLLFGNRAEGHWNPWSDIDLAVIGVATDREAQSALQDQARAVAETVYNPLGVGLQVFAFSQSEFEELRTSRPPHSRSGAVPRAHGHGRELATRGPGQSLARCQEPIAAYPLALDRCRHGPCHQFGALRSGLGKGSGSRHGCDWCGFHLYEGPEKTGRGHARHTPGLVGGDAGRHAIGRTVAGALQGGMAGNGPLHPRSARSGRRPDGDGATTVRTSGRARLGNLGQEAAGRGL